MAGISFDEDQGIAQVPVSQQAPALVRLVMRWGFASDQKAAERFLLWTVGACVLLAIAVFLFMAPRTPEPATPLDPTWPKPVTR